MDSIGKHLTKDNAPDLWSASAWLRESWPNPKVREKCMYVRVTRLKEKAPKTPTVHLQTRTFVHLALTLTRQTAATTDTVPANGILRQLQLQALQRLRPC